MERGKEYQKEQENLIPYELEELVPIVAELARKHNGIDSSSISYEKANSLMETVIFCIMENYNAKEQSLQQEVCSGKHNTESGESEDMQMQAQFEKLSAFQAYKRGRVLVEQKVKDALALYHAILKKFDDYGNYYLKQTIIAGMPEFFKWYDARFAAHETMLTLDYHVLRDRLICRLKGIDAIYEYLKCIEIEQNFLGKMSRTFVMQCLNAYNSSYKDMVDNLCSPVLEHIVYCVLLDKKSFGETLTNEERKTAIGKLYQDDINDWMQYVQKRLQEFFAEYYDKDIYWYLRDSVRDVFVRFTNLSKFETF